ncbi:hypothetical protein IKQ21_05290 [bacterium]|nr:hypothetical protein [bacterium]
MDKETEHNPNILGIIDGNSASWGTEYRGYKIFSKDILNTVHPDGIILTVFNKNECIYPELKRILEENNPEVELLPNIFDM